MSGEAERLRRIDNVPAYVERLIANVVIDAIREHAAERRMVLLSHEIATREADAQADNSDPADLVADAEIAAGAGLTRKQRRLLATYQQHGSTEAVADVLDIDMQRACERVSRLIRAIREQQHDDAA